MLILDQFRWSELDHFRSVLTLFNFFFIYWCFLSIWYDTVFVWIFFIFRYVAILVLKFIPNFLNFMIFFIFSPLFPLFNFLFNIFIEMVLIHSI